jgi:methylmalonyl-CoA/ethylmalonyl-CoA epimerase
MVKSIHHINFLVRDLEAAIPVYERLLGIPVTRRDTLEARGVMAARFRLGESWLVLVQPIRTDGVPARHLAEHGEGFFLLSLEVQSIDAEQDRLGSAVFAGPRRRGAENWTVADLDPRLTSGAQWQLCEVAAE